MSQLPTCPNCKSTEVTDKTANKFYIASAIFAVLGVVFLFINWGIGIFLLVVMVFCLTAVVAHPSPTHSCRSCGNEWK